MCGFVALFDLNQDHNLLRQTVLDQSKKIRHRGPDWSGVFSSEQAIISHERLAIVDPTSGGQPLYNDNKTLVLAVNGEIYNHQSIRKQSPSYNFLTQSDCEVILSLYQEKGVSFLDDLNGIFAFALYDVVNNCYLIARDHMGIIPLYMGWDDKGQFYVASELKALEGVCKKIQEFKPGNYWLSTEQKFVQWYKRDWVEYDHVKNNLSNESDIRHALEEAVERQLMCDVPYGVLLSGGLDSSVISAIAKKLAPNRIESGGRQQAWYPQLHSFAVGLEGSPDLKAAQEVATYLGTIHHQVHFTIQEGLDALRDVIYHIETYDVTTIRASTPMYLLARVIKSMGIKMVLSGEGSDELFGGYLYFHKAPNAEAFHEETVRKLSKLNLYDCLRANKSLAAWGIEGRVPFLDKEFMDIAMTQNPTDKMCGNGKIEKHILRSAFQNYLPDSVLWRQKEQFSDGVGYSWIDSLKEMTSKSVTDEEMAKASFKFPIHTPKSKEEYYYRNIFFEHFPSDAAALCVPNAPSVACSTPEALAWDPAFKNMNDPSGRSIKGVHDQSYKVRLLL
jgi:asparagine synthase (glutamine-hydrolysing)